MDNLTTEQKISALVDFGLADDEEDARAMLIDMGEIDDPDDPDSLGYIPASEETCIHPSVFARPGHDFEHCYHCDRDIPATLL